MKTLVVLNDLAYGSERSYNALRLAHSLAKREGEEVRIFLLADAVTCALAGQQAPDGYYNLERLLAAANRRGAQVGLCGTPPRIVRAQYMLTIATDEPAHRLDLLHRNILRFGTSTNTLAAACELTGEIDAEPPTAGKDFR